VVGERIFATEIEGIESSRDPAATKIEHRHTAIAETSEAAMDEATLASLKRWHRVEVGDNCLKIGVGHLGV
jgi:hypothetical protein